VRRRKNTTINDIAELAGVAKSTVSRYLNGGHVSEKTQKRICRVNVEKEHFSAFPEKERVMCLIEKQKKVLDGGPFFF
jgi:transcriptional regulator with XRE-family HTH domain